jgi:hypothetical protein
MGEGAFRALLPPREEHLLPLHVCAAMAGRLARVVFDDLIMGKRGVAFMW